MHDRVAIWTNPWADPAHTGYQIIQGTYALAAGGTTGTGLGLGDPTRIPAVHNDFIFAAIGEELGLVGTTAILVAFLLLIGAGLRIATRAERPFEKALAAGLTTIVGVQAFVIIGGVIRVVPLTGVTLPFVSYGGSSLARQLRAARHPAAHQRHHARSDSVRCRRARRRRKQDPARHEQTAQEARPGPHRVVRVAVRTAQHLQVVRANDYNNDPAQQP